MIWLLGQCIRDARFRLHCHRRRFASVVVSNLSADGLKNGFELALKHFFARIIFLLTPPKGGFRQQKKFWFGA